MSGQRAEVWLCRANQLPPCHSWQPRNPNAPLQSAARGHLVCSLLTRLYLNKLPPGLRQLGLREGCGKAAGRSQNVSLVVYERPPCNFPNTHFSSHSHFLSTDLTSACLTSSHSHHKLTPCNLLAEPHRRNRVNNDGLPPWSSCSARRSFLAGGSHLSS
jgi:hypothetical protein